MTGTHLLCLGDSEGFCKERGDEVLKTEFLRRLAIEAFDSIDGVGHEKASGIVKALTDEFGEQDFITLGIRCIPELRKYF